MHQIIGFYASILSTISSQLWHTTCTSSIVKCRVREPHKWSYAEKCSDYRPVRLAYKPYFSSKRIIFFSHNKSTNSTFSHSLSAKRTRRIPSHSREVLANAWWYPCTSSRSYMDPYHCTSMEMSVFYDVPPFHAEVIANFLKESWAKKKTHTLNLCTCLVLVNGHNPQQIFCFPQVM